MPSPQTHLAFIDGLRAVAALAVVFEHGVTRGFFVGGNAHEAWRYMPGRGVELFFVISGFCLAYPFLARVRSGVPARLDYMKFLADRLTRIAPPYYVVLCILGLMSLTPLGFPGDALRSPVAPSLAASTFARDVIFSTSGHQVFNDAFWTLGIEMHWYLVCPLLILLYLHASRLFVALMPLLYWAYFLPPAGLPSVLEVGTLPCFMLGIFAADVCLSENPVRRFAWVAIPILAGVIATIDATSINPADPLWHLLAFFLVVAGSTNPLRPLLSLRPLVVTGLASYSIYLVHLPVVWGLQKQGLGVGIPVAAGIAAGFAFWWFVERRFLEPAVRGRMRGAVFAALQRASHPLQILRARAARS